MTIHLKLALLTFADIRKLLLNISTSEMMDGYWSNLECKNDIPYFKGKI